MISREQQKRKDGAAAALLARQSLMRDPNSRRIILFLETGEGKGCDMPGLYCPAAQRLRELEKPNYPKSSWEKRKRKRRTKRKSPAAVTLTFQDWLASEDDQKKESGQTT